MPVDSFFHRYMDLLGVGRQNGSMPPGTEAGSANARSQAGPYSGQQVQASTGLGHQPQPNFRYPATVNYLAQLTGRDLHHQSSQPRSSLPVEQLDASLQQRQPPGQLGFAPAHRGSPQPDVLAYPSSSLAHFQQMLQAQAGNAQVSGTSMAGLQASPHGNMPGHPSLLQTNPASQGVLQTLQQWQNPKPALPSGKSNQDLSHSNQHANLDPTSQAMLSPRYPSTGRGPLASTSSPASRQKPHELQGAGSRGLQEPSRGDQSELDDDGQSTGSRLPSGALSRTNRTPRQQLQNKQAQQRYRERRKMKVTEMEQALAAMSQQVDELQGVLKQNVALQDKTLRLEQMVSERDTKIEQLASQLKSASAQPANVPDQDVAHEPDEARRQVTPALDGMSHLKLEFQGQIMKLQQFIEANNLRKADPFGSDVPRDVTAHLTEMVEDGLRVCRKVQAEGIQVLDLITHSPSSLDEVGTAQEREKWVAAVRAVKMTALQTEQLLLWRDEHLRNMHAIYEQRQHLNMQALRKMNPGAEDEPIDQHSSAKLVEAMEKEGYLPTAKANLELCEALEKIKENLKFEQRSVLQFNWVLVHRILSPIQVALFMVHAWPSHCDCLAMVNTVNSIKHELMAGASGRLPASSHSENGTPMAAATEPMDMDVHPPPMAPPLTHPSGPPQPAGPDAGTAPSANSHRPGAQQATPFASAFRPVVPTKRDSGSATRKPAAGQPPPGLFQNSNRAAPATSPLPLPGQQTSPATMQHPFPNSPLGSGQAPGSTTGPKSTSQSPTWRNSIAQIPARHVTSGQNPALPGAHQQHALAQPQQKPVGIGASPSNPTVAGAASQQHFQGALQSPQKPAEPMPATQQRQLSVSDSVDSPGMSSVGPLPASQNRQPSPQPTQPT